MHPEKHIVGQRFGRLIVIEDIGYLENNVVSCCKICNYAKHDQSYDDFIKYLKRVSKIWYE